MNTKPKKIYRNLLDVGIGALALVVSFILFNQHNAVVERTADNRPPLHHQPVDPAKDLIYGNPEADVFIVEYGDLECPFCKEFHPSVKRVIEGPQGISGRVAWVWRNGFHVNETSIEKAETLECVKKYAGENGRVKTWEFIEESLLGGVLEEEYPYERYKEIIESLEIDFEKVDICRKDNEVQEKLQEDFNEIVKLDIQETPLLHFISGNGELLFHLTGALTTVQIESILREILTSGDIANFKRL